jgi:hypothetical protein
MAMGEDSFDRPQNEDVKISSYGGNKFYGEEIKRKKIHKREWIIFYHATTPSDKKFNTPFFNCFTF